jgi:hypothetical protein
MREEMGFHGRLIAQVFWGELEKIARKSVADLPQALGHLVAKAGPSEPTLASRTVQGLGELAGKTVADEQAARQALPGRSINWRNFFRPGEAMVQDTGRGARKASKGREKEMLESIQQELLRRQQALTGAVQQGSNIQGATRELGAISEQLPTLGMPGRAGVDPSAQLLPQGAPRAGGQAISPEQQGLMGGMSPFAQQALTGGGLALGGAGALYAGQKYLQSKQQPRYPGQ